MIIRVNNDGNKSYKHAYLYKARQNYRNRKLSRDLARDLETYIYVFQVMIIRGEKYIYLSFRATYV